MKEYITLMRPKHYLKNVLLFLPLIFSGLLVNKHDLLSCCLAFIAFSLAASTVYIINDIRDCEKDKNHEKKKHRPIASGKIKKSHAIIFAILLFLLSYGFNVLATGQVAHTSYLYILVYIFINILYSLGLKDIPLVDVTILVIGFLLRVLYGASIIGVTVSNWLYLTIVSGSFYMGLGKRRNEIIKNGAKSRKVLAHYNQDFLDKNMYMCLALTIIFYALWCTSFKNSYVIWTVPFVILLCMRYSMQVESDSYGDPVDVIVSDPVLMIMGAITGVTLLLMLYIGAL